MSNYALVRRPSRAVVGALALLAACGTTSQNLVFNVDPPTAAVYINGERQGQGGRRPYDISFAGHERAYVQATAPGFEPWCEWFTEQKILEMINLKLELPVTLRKVR